MAEIATGVLHNVGNVLNSVNVSATLLRERIQRSRVSSVTKISELLNAHREDLGDFFINDPKGRRLPDYLAALAGHLQLEQGELLTELMTLFEGIDHVKQIVAMQQAHAKSGGVVEKLALVNLVEDALRLNAAAILKEKIQLIRLFQETPLVLVDRHKTLQILVNLTTNAVHAIREGGKEERRIIVGIAWNGSDRVRLIVQDNGKGISPENLSRIFQHGFTTRKDGHGFGLHSGALAAKDMGGSLTVHSDGPGCGAIFVIELPAAEGGVRQEPPASRAA